jgi:hypothetical protein
MPNTNMKSIGFTVPKDSPLTGKDVKQHIAKLERDNERLASDINVLKKALAELHSFFKRVLADPSIMDAELDRVNTQAIDTGVKLCE